MKFYLSCIIIGIILNILNYNLFLKVLAVLWYIASILILYLAFKKTYQYKFIQINFKKIFRAIKSKSKNNISPISSLCVTLAGKIGVGSLSGVALTLYYGGLGAMFWLFIISLLVSINTYIECMVSVSNREKINGNFVSGPSYYIKKCLNNKKLANLYSILIIISYSIIFLSIQTNTVVNSFDFDKIDKNIIVIILFFSTLLIILKGIKGITDVNKILVPMMLVFYFMIGIYVFIFNYSLIIDIFILMIKEAFNIKSFLTGFLIGMQRAIFITESSIGTSAISSSICDNDGSSQGLLEVFGIHITTFVVCMTSFLIIITSDYNIINFNDINGIEIILYAFKYHFGNLGIVFLNIITLLFAFSTIIASYFFGESNLNFISNKKITKILYMIVFLLVIIFSGYLKAKVLWNLCDYFVSILVIINISSLIKITK